MLRFNICALEFILYLTNSHRAVFTWVLKRILDCFSFALFRSVIGLENSHLSLNQSNADISSWSVAFSRASTRLIVFDFSLDRDDVDLFFLNGGCDYFGYVGRQSLITVLFHSMLYAPESFSKKCETISQFSMIISQSQTCRPSFV